MVYGGNKLTDTLYAHKYKASFLPVITILVLALIVIMRADDFLKLPGLLFGFMVLVFLLSGLTIVTLYTMYSRDQR